MTQAWIDASRKAEALALKVELEEQPHWAKDLSDHEGYKRYDVKLKGKVIGRVENVREHIYRKAGRLITRSWHRKAWGYSADGLSAAGMYYLTRKRTVYELLYHLILHDKLKVK